MIADTIPSDPVAACRAVIDELGRHRWRTDDLIRAHDAHDAICTVLFGKAERCDCGDTEQAS